MTSVVLTRAGKDLLRTALIALDDAYQAPTAADRYVAAHVAALRAGAALLATRAKPTRSSRIRSVWQMLPTIAPELQEWCTYFALIGQRRVFVEIGRTCHTAAGRRPDARRGGVHRTDRRNPRSGTADPLDVAHCGVSMFAHPHVASYYSLRHGSAPRRSWCSVPPSWTSRRSP